MNPALPALPPDLLLCRKHVCHYLKWSRTTLWRREREGLRFFCGQIEFRRLQRWLAQRDRPFR